MGQGQSNLRRTGMWAVCKETAALKLRPAGLRERSCCHGGRKGVCSSCSCGARTSLSITPVPLGWHHSQTRPSAAQSEGTEMQCGLLADASHNGGPGLLLRRAAGRTQPASAAMTPRNTGACSFHTCMHMPRV
eukprot:366029-Chlamydomonas_euryale.AAC.51